MNDLKPIIAITGGIASGKSTITNMFKDLGNCEIICADKVAHQVMEPGMSAYQGLVATFGKQILVDAEDNTSYNSIDQNNQSDSELNSKLPIDRKKLRSLVFDKSTQAQQNLQLLDSIVHPCVLTYSQQLFKQSTKDYILWDVPLLYETDLHQYANQVIVISCDQETRINRALSRDSSLTRYTLNEIMASQATDVERESIANYIIINNNTVTKSQLTDKVIQLNQIIMDTMVTKIKTVVTDIIIL